MKLGAEGRGNNRRKSLAEFQEIHDAVGNAFGHAASPSGTIEADFNQAVDEQVRISYAEGTDRPSHWISL
jgi:hypothetical protein